MNNSQRKTFLFDKRRTKRGKKKEMVDYRVLRTNNPTFGFGDVYCAWPRAKTVRGCVGAWAQGKVA